MQIVEDSHSLKQGTRQGIQDGTFYVLVIKKLQRGLRLNSVVHVPTVKIFQKFILEQMKASTLKHLTSIEPKQSLLQCNYET